MTEDLSKRTRESRQELRKFMRGIKKRNPERYCVLEYDKLFVDHKVYVWNDILGQVVEMNDSERSLDPVTRAASAMGRGARPGLSKSWSVSSPNIVDNTETDILERIRDLEAQIAAQQVQPSSRMLRLPSKNLFQHNFQETIHYQQQQISEFGGVKDGGYESQSTSSSSASGLQTPGGATNMANLSLSLSINGDQE